MSHLNRKLLLTIGEPAGIGPDIILQLAAEGRLREAVVLGDLPTLQDRAEQLKISLEFQDYKEKAVKENALRIWHHPVKTTVIPGQLNLKNTDFVLDALCFATEACLKKEFSVLITGPVHKGIIHQSGTPFSGQTEFIANLCHVKKPVMMLANATLRVALVTTHLPLSQVPKHITFENVETTLRIVHEDLIQHFRIPDPLIAVCGLNPHAGEQGHLGKEEIDIIEPVVDKLKKEGYRIEGPWPADTIFTQYSTQREIPAAIVAMYHDQGLPVLKYAGFGSSINMTLGLPMIRLSVDHGTALSLAGKGGASSSSLQTAITFAEKLIEPERFC